MIKLNPVYRRGANRAVKHSNKSQESLADYLLAMAHHLDVIASIVSADSSSELIDLQIVQRMRRAYTSAWLRAL